MAKHILMLLVEGLHCSGEEVGRVEWSAVLWVPPYKIWTVCACKRTG